CVCKEESRESANARRVSRELKMQRPSWLRWHGFRMSTWLAVAFLVMGLPWLVVSFTMPLLRVLPKLQAGSFEDSLRLVNQTMNQPSARWLLAWAFVTQALLVSFTFYSGNSHVKEQDKFWVFVAMCLAAVSWLQLILTWAGVLDWRIPFS